MTTALDNLKTRLGEIHDLGMVNSVLSWDQQVQMPPGGGPARARQLGLIARMSHEMLTADETGDLLEKAAAELNGDYDSDDASLVRVFKEDYEKATRIPAELVSAVTRESALAHEVWVKARAEKDFSQFQPTLEKLVELVREMAEHLGYEDTPYDALLGQYERGMTTAQVKAIFDAHRPPLVDLIQAISEADQVDDSMLHQPFDIDKQKRFALDIVKQFGFDFDRGVQDVAVHPFCTSFSVNDVRITTRFEENFLNPALFGMMHEAGHGMYEQGVAQSLEGTPLASGTSLGVHESQSRMWENIVGRSRGFWSWALPKLKATFPNQLWEVELEDFYKAVNRVERSFIRVEADEATYNLHIILRFELEQEIVNGTLAVKDVRDAWNSRFEDFFGIAPPDDALGVLQDVHWSAGLMGYFSTYALGNLLSVQYYNQAVKDQPSIPDEIANGQFETLLTWLNENVHQHGRKYTGDELTRRITGEGISSEPYMAYLTEKFSDIYGL